VARTVCRRAERRVVALHSAAEDGGPPPHPALHPALDPAAGALLNRLSDYLFVAARVA